MYDTQEQIKGENHYAVLLLFLWEKFSIYKDDILSSITTIYGITIKHHKYNKLIVTFSNNNNDVNKLITWTIRITIS